MDTNKIKTLTRDIRYNLEDIIVKLNHTSPQQMHDDIIPLLEDLEILEMTVGVNGGRKEDVSNPFTVNPTLTNDMVKGTTGTMWEILNQLSQGVNGGHQPIDHKNEQPKEIELNLSIAIFELYELAVRLQERLSIEPDNPNMSKIKAYSEDLRIIAAWLMHQDLIDMNDEDPKEDEDENSDEL